MVDSGEALSGLGRGTALKVPNEECYPALTAQLFLSLYPSIPLVVREGTLVS